MEMTSAREAGEISLCGSIKFVPEFLWPLVEVPADSYLCHCIQLCVHFLRAYFIEGVLYTGKKIVQDGELLVHTCFTSP